MTYDNFNRANGSLGLATTGEAWTTYRGIFAITSNQAAPTDSLVANGAMAAIDTQISDIDMTIGLNWITATSRSVNFRGVDDLNYWKLQYDQVFAVVAGNSVGGADPRRATLTSNLVTGDIARIRTLGSTIEIYKNSTLVATLDSTGTFDTATQVGIAAFNDNTARWDNLSVLESCTTPPANDNWADAIDLGSALSGSVEGTTACATVEDDEPGITCSL